MKKELGKGEKVSAKVTNTKKGSESADPFNENLNKEAKGLEEAKRKFKMDEPDTITKFLQTLLELKAPPLFKRDFTDPRWPRNEVGENIQVDRVYFFAMEGPKKSLYGFPSLGDQEVNGDGKVIIDVLKLVEVKNKTVRVSDEIIQAKKWLAEKSGYRYFWIHEDEEFEDDDAEKVFLERFEKLTEKPSFTFKESTTLPSVEGDYRFRY